MPTNELSRATAQAADIFIYARVSLHMCATLYIKITAAHTVMPASSHEVAPAPTPALASLVVVDAPQATIAAPPAAAPAPAVIAIARTPTHGVYHSRTPACRACKSGQCPRCCGMGAAPCAGGECGAGGGASTHMCCCSVRALVSVVATTNWRTRVGQHAWGMAPLEVRRCDHCVAVCRAREC